MGVSGSAAWPRLRQPGEAPWRKDRPWRGREGLSSKKQHRAICLRDGCAEYFFRRQSNLVPPIVRKRAMKNKIAAKFFNRAIVFYRGVLARAVSISRIRHGELFATRTRSARASIASIPAAFAL
jgi:hypothetical protein